MPATPDPFKPLRILHLTAGSDAGGLSRYIFNLASAMQQQGHDVAVAGQRGAWHWLFEPALFQWIDAPMKGGLLSLRKSARILSRWIDQHPIDLLHVHYRKCSMVGRQIQKIHRVPMLYTLHLSDLRLSWPWNYFTDFGDHAHVASTEARDWLRAAAKVPLQNITLIPHGVDPDHFCVPMDADKTAARASLGLAQTDRVAAYVGRLDSPKNEEWLLDVAARSMHRIPNLKILIVGEGPHESSLRRQIAEMSLASRVTLTGHRDSLGIYHAADALLLPSTREGFSLVCAEAMATGIPVLRTRTAGTRELISENVTGQSVPVDRETFVSAALDFLSDGDELKRMGTAAAAHIRSHYPFDRQLKATVEMYRSLIDQAR